MEIPSDLIELFSAFADAGVQYLLVGGHAVAAHGRPRSTKDVDLWLAPDRENIARACLALAAFGAVSFADAWPRRLTIVLSGVSVPVLGKEDLIRNKQAVGRPQDRRDVRALLGEPRGVKAPAKRKPK